MYNFSSRDGNGDGDDDGNGNGNKYILTIAR